MKTKELTIGVLAITATILFVGLLVVNLLAPAPAYAFGQNAAGGDYVVSTAQLDQNTEIVYVLDAGVQRLNAYGFNTTANGVELIASMDVRMRERERERER